MVSELASRCCDRYNITCSYVGTDDHTLTGLAERWIALVRYTSLKTWSTCQQQDLAVSQEDVGAESTMVTNSMITHGNVTPNQIVLGFEPKDFYDIDSMTLDSATSALEASPDPFETGLRIHQGVREQSQHHDHLAC